MRQHEFLVLVGGTSTAKILAQTAIVEGVCKVIAGTGAIGI